MTPRILVIDDAEHLRSVLVLTLKFKGYEVVEAGDGQEALQAVQAGPFDLIFCDIEMPVMNGLDFVRRSGRQWGVGDAHRHADGRGRGSHQGLHGGGSDGFRVQALRADPTFGRYSEIYGKPGMTTGGGTHANRKFVKRGCITRLPYAEGGIIMRIVKIALTVAVGIAMAACSLACSAL